MPRPDLQGSGNDTTFGPSPDLLRPDVEVARSDVLAHLSPLVGRSRFSIGRISNLPKTGFLAEVEFRSRSDER